MPICSVSKELLLFLKGFKRQHIKLILLITLLLLCGDIESNPGPLDSMYIIITMIKERLLLISSFTDSQPTSKRPRTAICVCSKCYGAERDYRTVERHIKEAYSAQAMTTLETLDPS